MATYLVDFENVHSDGLKGIDLLDEKDRVFLFYSQNADSITFDTHFRLLRSKASFEMFEAKRLGKNAIDFHLATYLGYLLALNPDETFFIVSKDNGFQFSFDFWRQYFRESRIKLFYAYSIERALILLKQSKITAEQQVAAAPVSDDADSSPAAKAEAAAENNKNDLTATPDEENESVRLLRAKLNGECTDEELVKLAHIIDNAGGKQDIYRGIIKFFGQTRGLVIYKIVKK